MIRWYKTKLPTKELREILETLEEPIEAIGQVSLWNSV